MEENNFASLFNLSDYISTHETLWLYQNLMQNSLCSGQGGCESDFEVSWTRYILELVLMPSVGAVGVLGNLISILVLALTDDKTTFKHSLITLAIINVLFLAIIIADHCIDVNSTTYILLFPHFMNPMKNIAVNSESFLIMAIALERLLVVWKPIRYRVGILRRSRRIHSLVFIVPPIIISFLINIPKFFETELVYFNVTNKFGNQDYLLDYRVTALRDDPDYIYYYIHWFRNLFTGIIPIIFLVIINTTIYVLLPSSSQAHYTTITFRRSQDGDSEHSLMEPSRRRSMLSRNSSDREVGDRRSVDVLLENLASQELIRTRQPSFRIQRRQTNYSALTLTSIVIMYIICNIPRLVLNLAEHLLQDEMRDNMDRCGCKKEPKWFTILCSISHFLLTVNSSANFIIYGSTENKFKKTLKDLIQSLTKRVRFLKLEFQHSHWPGE